MKSLHRCTPIRWAAAGLTAALLAACSRRADTICAGANSDLGNDGCRAGRRDHARSSTRRLHRAIAKRFDLEFAHRARRPRERARRQHVVAGTVLAVFDTSNLNAEPESDIHAAREAEANATKQYFAGAQTISTGNSNVANAESTLAQATAKARLDRVNLARDASILHQQYIAQQTYDSQLSTVQSDDAAIRSDNAALANMRLTASTDGSQSAGLQGATLASAREAAAQGSIVGASSASADSTSNDLCAGGGHRHQS
jgi:hypothetical protein